MNKRTLALLALAILLVGGLAYAGAKVRQLQQEVAAQAARK